MIKKRNARKKPGKKQKQPGVAWSGFSGSFQIIGISLLFGSVLFALVTVLEQISTSAAFQVNHIKWLGLQHLKEEEMLKRYDVVVGQNIFEVDIEAVHRRLLTNPRIKAATVKKDFPNRLLIIVEEKQPAAALFESDTYPEKLIKEASSVVIIDSEANVLQAGLAMQNFASLPAGLPRLLHFKKAAYMQALVLGAVLENRRGLFIDLSDPDDLLVYFTEGEEEMLVGRLHFGGEHFRERWARFLAIENDLNARGLLQWEIDLRFAGQAVVKNGAFQGSPVSGKSSDTTYF